MTGFSSRAVPAASPKRRAIAIIIGAGLLATALVLWHFRFREFYYDSGAQIIRGDEVRAARFLVNRGGVSGVGIANPPLFSWFMGVVTALTHDPAWITAMTSALNLMGLALALWYFAVWLPPVYAALAAILLAINPAALFYTNLLWEGAPLQPLAILFQVLAAGIVLRPRPRDFTLLMLTATAAALCHQSGFLLFLPAVLIGLMRRRQLGGKALLAGLILPALLFIPYGLFLVSPEGLAQIGRYAHQGGRTGAAVQARLHLGMSSIGIFDLFFSSRTTNLDGALRAAAPRWGWTAYALGMLPAVAFAAGWVRSIFGVLRGKGRPRAADPRDETLPIPTLVSGLVLTTVALQYLPARGVLWFKHLLVVYPAAAVLAAWPFWRFWRRRVVRVAFVVAAAASLALTLALLRHIERSGGTHAHGAIQIYGLSYDRLAKIRGDLRRLLPPGAAPELYAAGLWPAQIETAVLRDLSQEAGRRVPILLLVAEEPARWTYSWALRPLGDDLARHRRAIAEALRIIPVGASVAASDPVADGGHALAWFGVPGGVVDTLFERLAARGRVERYQAGTALVGSGAEYLALDTADPRVPANLTPSEIWRVVREGSYRLIFAHDGVAVLQRGPGDGLGDDDLVAGFGRFPVSALAGNVGRRRPNGDPVGIEVRSASTGDPAGFLLFGPWITLNPGVYRAAFAIKSAIVTRSGPARFEVTGRKGTVALAAADDDAAGNNTHEWRNIAVEFTVPPGGMEDVEFRVFYRGKGTLDVASVTLTRHDRGSD